jgi:hypothetical protein
MWEQRNNMLHNQGETIHRHEQKPLDIEIREEMRIGQNGLHIKYQDIFLGTLQSKLDSNMSQKQMWIMSVWAAIDNNEEVYNGGQRNEDIELIYRRWRKRNKRTTIA